MTAVGRRLATTPRHESRRGVSLCFRSRQADAEFVAEFTLGRIEVFRIHGFEENFSRNVSGPAAPSAFFAWLPRLDRHEAGQWLAGARNHDLLAGQGAVEQFGQFRLRLG